MIAFALALMVFSAFPLITFEQSHISVSLLEGKLAPRFAWIERLCAIIVTLASTAVISYELYLHGKDQAANQQVTPVLSLQLAPLSFAIAALSAGAVIACVVLLVQHVRTSPGRVPRSKAGLHEI